MAASKHHPGGNDMTRIARLLAASAVAATAATANAAALRYDTDLSIVAGAAAEIPAYDSADDRFFVVGIGDDENSFVRIFDARTGAPAGALDLGAVPGGSANSVAVSATRVAVAVAAANRTDPGSVLVWNLTDLGAAPARYTVGSLPDQLSFTPDGTRLVVANEGEPAGLSLIHI